MNEGWIKLHRQIKEWQHYQEPYVLLVWLDLLLSANSKAGWSRGNRINRGQLITSVARIMESTGIGSDNTVREALCKLEESGEIKREQIGIGTKITINHFNKFQTSAQDAQISAQPTAEGGAQPSAEVDAQPTAEGGADKQEYIEGEEGNKEKNINPHTPARARERDFKTFGTFKNVKLTDGDMDMLRQKLAAEGKDEAFLDRCIEKLSAFMAQEGRTYQNHAAAILSWARNAVAEEDRRTGGIYRQGTAPICPSTPPPQEERELTDSEKAIIEEWQAFTSEWREEKEKYAKLNEIAQRHGGIAPELLPKLGMMQWKDKWIFK